MGCHKKVICFPAVAISIYNCTCGWWHTLCFISCWCSSLGKPRRFSERFLHEEKEKLKQYRKSVRTHYTELRTGAREGLPRDLARPLSVGQRVIALHPKTREVHNGSVLTVDHDKCMVQFDCAEIGVEFVMVVHSLTLSYHFSLMSIFSAWNIFFSLFTKISSKNVKISLNEITIIRNIHPISTWSWRSLASNFMLMLLTLCLRDIA